MSMKDIQELKDNFSYCPETGELVRLTRRNSNGSIDKDGYRIVKFKKRQIKSHRLCWAIHHGKWPDGVIDHIDGDKLNNRISNLRDVPQSENNKNTPARGIWVDHKTNGLKAKYRVSVGGSHFNFRSEDEAVRFREQADLKAGILRRSA